MRVYTPLVDEGDPFLTWRMWVHRVSASGSIPSILGFFFLSLSLSYWEPLFFPGFLLAWLFSLRISLLLERIRTKDLCNLAGEIGVERRQVTRQSSPISTGETRAKDEGQKKKIESNLIVVPMKW